MRREALLHLDSKLRSKKDEIVWQNTFCPLCGYSAFGGVGGF
jgi:hypothetical protein